MSKKKRWNTKEGREERERKAEQADASWKEWTEESGITEITPLLWRKWIIERKGRLAPSAHELAMVGLEWADISESNWFKRLNHGWVFPSPQGPEEKFTEFVKSMLDDLTAEEMHNLIEDIFPRK